MVYEYDGMRFSWDDKKYIINKEKHGIYFEEAASVFADENAVYLPDYSHSYYEERFIIIGFSQTKRLLTVCHCEKKNGEITRIISARKAENAEKKIYKGGIL